MSRWRIAAALLLAAWTAPAAAEVGSGVVDPVVAAPPGTPIPGAVVPDLGTSSVNPLPEAGIKGRRLDWPVQAVVPFSEDRQQLTDAARSVLKTQAEWLKANPNAKLLVVGYLNGEGTREYLLSLSLRLAEAVKNELVESGVAGDRVATVGYGKEKPAECGADLSGQPVRVCTVSLPYAAD
ncbi:MAG TPA: OmpA family protein [Alphaproteobacteria bacterium]|jgi:peptidoglycan-associated lipoprotein